MEKVCPWCGQPSDQGRLKNRTEQNVCELILTLMSGSHPRICHHLQLQLLQQTTSITS